MTTPREESPELLQWLVESAAPPVALLDRDGFVRHLNRALETMLGVASADLIGRSLSDRIHPDDRALLARLLEPGPPDSSVPSLELRVRHGDGSFKTLSVAAARPPSASQVVFSVVWFDDHASSQPHPAPQPDHAWYRLLFERNLAGVFRSTLAGRIVYCNQAFARILGRASPEELMAPDAPDVHPTAAARENLIEELRRSGELVNHQMVLVRADGSPVWVLANIALVGDGQNEPTMFEGTMVDITERKLAEDRLLLHSKALESASSAIIITDAEGVIQWANPAFGWLTGYSPEEAVGRHTRILRSGRHPDSFYRELWQTISAGSAWHGELVNRRKDGTLYTQETTITPMRSADGDIDYFIAVANDVTERRRIEEQLRQSQRMEAVGRLAGGVAHDFNNLLQAMQGLSELMQRPGTDAPEASTRLRELEGHIQRASQLTRQLLLFSRPSSLQQEPLDLNRVVADTVLLLGRLIRENVELILELGDGTLPLEADRGQLEQIVLNLAVNASEAMPDGGRLWIRTGAADGTVWLEVTDTGDGIPREIRERLFEPFFTTKERGRNSGLGLSVVHGIVALHRGRIELDSEQGVGTTFRIILPAIDASLLPTKASDTQPLPFAGGGERILVVEDDAAVRESLREILEGLGYRVTTAANCQEAERLPEQADFDLLLSDFGLPDGTGTEIAAVLQLRWPSLRVIIMSGYAEDDVIARHILSGDLHFLQKPFTVQTLDRAVRSVLSQGHNGVPAERP